MLILISPAKSLNLEDPAAVPATTQPSLLDEAEVVAKRMRRFSRRGLSDLMGIGDKLAALNVERFKAKLRPYEWRPVFAVLPGRWTLADLGAIVEAFTGKSPMTVGLSVVGKALHSRRA